MKRIIRVITIAVLATASSLALPQTAAAAGPGPITIDGVVYDKQNQPFAGAVVVAWCGGISFFGGSGTTDANGHYIINTDSDACPFDNELTVTTDIDYDGQSDGARHTQVHTKTTINIYLGSYTSVPVPEYSWLGASLALLGGAGVIGFMRRTRLGAQR